MHREIDMFIPCLHVNLSLSLSSPSVLVLYVYRTPLSSAVSDDLMPCVPREMLRATTLEEAPVACLCARVRAGRMTNGMIVAR